MKKALILMLALPLLLSGLAGCGPRVPTDYDGLAAALENAGFVVTVSPTGDKAWVFEVPVRPLAFDGHHISVYEFPDSGVARSASERVWPDGYFIDSLPLFSEDSPIQRGAAAVEWVGPPHFFLSGKLIVLYTGPDPQVYALLTDLLGAQFAGSPAP